MTDPRNRGAAAETPIKGEGCLRRFDPEAMSDQHGADFSAAALLWQALQPQPEKSAITPVTHQGDPAAGA